MRVIDVSGNPTSQFFNKDIKLSFKIRGKWCEILQYIEMVQIYL